LNVFVTPDRKLRNGVWVAIFFHVLALLVVPVVVLARRREGDVPIALQAALVAVSSMICQALRRRPLSELTGPFDARALGDLLRGGGMGAALMLLPALLLLALHRIVWEWSPPGIEAVASTLSLFAAVAVAEELLFRGFVFQRLVAGIGAWPAQLVMGAYFLLTHAGNPGMVGSTRLWASVNIFLASILFGLAYLRTRGLAWPVGMHWMANWAQGGLLGLGVSGEGQRGLWAPTLDRGPAWLTGGAFGLEASVPGLACVVAALVVLCVWPEAVVRKPRA
jgi:membrane protease YdiL (CAAX protease family)